MIGSVQSSGFNGEDKFSYLKPQSPPIAGAGEEHTGASPSKKDQTDSIPSDQEKQSDHSRNSLQGKKVSAEQLSTRDLVLIRKLKTTDQQVRKHEQAHVSVGGRYITGAAEYSYQIGPDGKKYAVAGEVQIDTSEENSPQATLVKAQMVRRAALAPADPSPQDRAVAAAATRMEQQARIEIREQQRAEKQASLENSESTTKSLSTEGIDNNGDTEKTSSIEQKPVSAENATPPVYRSGQLYRNISDYPGQAIDIIA